MTVKELLERLVSLVEQGCGEHIVKIYNGDSEQLEAVSGYLYGGTDGVVELCSDDYDEEQSQ